jgi:hypothetical protein
VALIFSDIPNLKVEGSSPSFGYSYETTLATILLHCLRVLGEVVDKRIFLVGEACVLADRVGAGPGNPRIYFVLGSTHNFAYSA